MRRLSVIVSIALLLTALPVAVGTSDAPTARSFEIPLAFAGTDGVLETEVVDHPFTLAGLAWEGDAPSQAWFRTASDGVWSEWFELAIQPDHGPDPNTAEARRSKSASDPVWTGPGDAVQFRIAGARPGQAWAALVDTTDRTKPALERFFDRLTPVEPQADAALPQPAIHPRSDWDPGDTCINADEPETEYVQVTVMFVHHTATSNGYSQADVAGQIAAICSYHVFTNGWDDIAYNFLIDSYGGIWEGRRGGIDKGVRGAHTGGFNTYATGVGLLGTLSTTTPSAAMQGALTDLLAWKASVHNLDLHGTTDLISKGSTKYEAGTPVTFDTVSGHRDASSTSCPGDGCYNLLPHFRAGAGEQWTQTPFDTYASPLTGDFTGDGVTDGASLRTSDGTWVIIDGADASTTEWPALPAGKTWRGHVAADTDGNGIDEIASFDGTTWYIVRPAAVSTGASLDKSSGWVAHVAADVDRDSKDELASLHGPTATIYLSDGSTHDLGTSAALEGLVSGDVDVDGAEELIALTSNGTWLTAMGGPGGLTAGPSYDLPETSGWAFPLAGAFDAAGVDVAALHEPTSTWHLASYDQGGWNPLITTTKESKDHWSLAFVTDVDGDRRDEIMQLDAYNGLWYIAEKSEDSMSFVYVEDTPYRTTVDTGDAIGESQFLTYFAQEFTWLQTKIANDLDPGGVRIPNRLEGSDRYGTAAAVSAAHFAPGVDRVYIATGTAFPDALAGGSAAAQHGAPILLVDPNWVPTATATELERLAPGEIVVLGGTAAVSDTVADALEGFTSGDVIRIAGSDRYATAALISEATFAAASTVFVATGTNFPDALAGVPAAAAAGAPILLVNPAWLPGATLAELQRLEPAEIVILGGTGAVSEDVELAMGDLTGATVTRLAGADRFATAVAISEATFGTSPGAFLAVADNFPDALAAGPAAALAGMPILLVQHDAVPGVTLDELDRLAGNEVLVLGGDGVIEDTVLATLTDFSASGTTTVHAVLPTD